jgi:hypothetical protein
VLLIGFNFCFHFNTGSEPSTADLPFNVPLHNYRYTMYLNRYNINDVLNSQIGEKKRQENSWNRVKMF